MSRPLSKITAAIAFSIAAVSFSGSASANGRFPAANHISLHPSDPAQLFVRTTFGLLVSRDAGAKFEWLCESLVGYGGAIDPAVQMLHDGSLSVALFDGLRVSRDGGCSFQAAPPLEGQFVIDLAVDRDVAGSAVALTSTGIDGDKFYVQVFETTDSGATWAKLGAQLPDDLLAETLDPAPSRPQRIYVSGFTTPLVPGGPDRQGIVEVSDDRGATWARSLVDLAGDLSLYIAGVDPVDPDRVYARSKGVQADRLLVSSDGGATFSTVFTTKGALLGFALSPDGQRVAVSSTADGLWVAPRDSLAFAKVSALRATCLAWGKVGLHACTSTVDTGFSIGLSRDEGVTFEPLLPALGAIAGPISSCAADAPIRTECASEWASLVALFRPPSASGGAAGAPSTQTAPTDDTSDDDGCACTTATPRVGVPAALAAGAALAVLFAARSRSRKARRAALQSSAANHRA